MILPHRPNSIPIPIRMPESATRLIPKPILQIPQNPSLSPPIRSIIFSKRCISTAFSGRFLRLSLSGVLFAVGGRNECLRSRYRWCSRDILVVNVLHPIGGGRCNHSPDIPPPFIPFAPNLPSYRMDLQKHDFCASQEPAFESRYLTYPSYCSSMPLYAVDEE
jgi:hypothetical protein